MPLSRLIALIINAHPLELSSTQYSAAAGRTGIEERPVDCARFARRARSGARGRSRGHADQMVGIRTNPFFTMSKSQTPCLHAGEFAFGSPRMRMVEPTGIEPVTSSLQS